MIESKFKIFTLVAIISSLLLLVVMMFVIFILGLPNLPLYINVLLLILILSIFAYVIFGELRTKAIKLKLDDKSISIINFMGIGKGRRYDFKEFDGYKTSILSTEEQEFEYLYLLIEGRKVVKISEFYHSNYLEIKNAIKKRIRHSRS